MTLLQRLRRFWLDVHLWLGVGLAIAMIPIGLSGSALVWHEQIDPYVYPHRYAVTEGAPKPPSAYFDAARDAFGDQFRPSQLRMPAESGRPVIVVGAATGRPAQGQRPETRTAFIDPATAKVLDVANTRAEFWQIMHQLHGTLFIPEIGRQVVGYLGWGLFISAITGIWLWWPRNNAVIKALRWRRSPSTNFNLHHLFGFWIAIPLAVVAITGVYISFPPASRAFTGLFVPVSEAPARPGGPGGPGGGGQPMARTQMSSDAAVAAALQIAPGDLASVAVPMRSRREGAAAEWRIAITRAGEERPANVTVNDATGEVKVRAARGPELPGDGVPLAMRRIHDGADQHIAWQILVFLTGIAPALLGITGLVMWLRRSARRRALRRGANATA